MLTLLAMLCRPYFKGMEGYEPPSAELAAWLAEEGGAAADSWEDRELRRLEVEAFIAEHGGEG